jgi:hypothetical protein
LKGKTAKTALTLHRRLRVEGKRIKREERRDEEGESEGGEKGLRSEGEKVRK